MPFQARIRGLSKCRAECKDEERSLEFAHELQTALHEEIELMLEKVKGLPLLDRERRER